MGEMCSPNLWSSFLPHLGGRTLSSQLDAIAIMSFIISKWKFELIAFTFESV